MPSPMPPAQSPSTQPDSRAGARAGANGAPDATAHGARPRWAVRGALDRLLATVGGEHGWRASWLRPSWRWLAALVALVGLANLLVLAAQASALVHAFYLNADLATALVLPALAGHAPAGSTVILGAHPWYEEWWFMRATAGLAHYRQLWEAAPFLVGLLGIAAVAAGAWRALGWVAGLLSAVALLAASETLRGLLYTPDVHGLVVLHLGVLCGALLFVARRAARGALTPGVALLVGVPLAVFTGAGFTDQLLLVSGLGPFVLAPALCWWRTRTRAWLTVTGFALVVGVLAWGCAALFTHVMEEAHVVHSPFPITFVSLEAMLIDLQNLIGAFAQLGGGAFFGAPVSGANLLTFLAGALTLLALGATVHMLWHRARTWTAPAPPAAGPPTPAGYAAGGPSPPTPAGSAAGGPSLVAPRAPGTPGAAASVLATGPRELFAAFWGLVLVCVVGAFALTELSNTVGNARYLIGAWAALAALLGLLANGRAGRTALLGAVALFGLLNIHSELAVGVAPFGEGPNQRMTGAIERFARAHGASVGYSGYWDTMPVTWNSTLAVQLLPIQACGFPSGWCEDSEIQISSWYTPRPHTNTFLLVDTRPGVPLAITAPPANFGHPIAGEVLGEGFSIYVYNHDLAGDISP
jgi:hypothetical protein